ncbi:unnamed protein product [Prorocentrum cordatum]|uniref:PAS domain-containing protein n=1 Tax=Prorocentrum cordatum TaxID=2364126 RepID=A0ABN9XZ83_9DINO|nr:unnamed protein product [Polarella glacialis]
MGLFPHVATSSVGAAEQNAVFVSAVLCLAVCAAFVAHTLACKGQILQFWKAFTFGIQLSDPDIREEMSKKLRAEIQDNARRINFFVVIVWCCVNLSLMVIHIVAKAPRWMTFWQDVVCISVGFLGVFCQLALRHRQEQATVSAVYVVFMLGQTVFVSAGPAEQVPYIAIASLCMLSRALFSVACMRVPVVLGMTLLHFFCATAGFSRTEASCTAGHSSCQQQHMQIFCVVELVGDVAIIVCSVAWRDSCRLRILHEIQASISQRDSSASRSLLNIVCDATVELDERLHIVDETPRLASLLQHGTDRSLRGSSMVHFVVEEDRKLFTDRICSANDECMANVFHTRVRDGISNVLNMEVFHVRASGYLKPDSHLIGVREYADATEHVATLSSTGPELAGRGTRAQSTRARGRRPSSRRSWEARLPDAEPRGSLQDVWSSSSSSSSSARSLSCVDGETAAVIDVLSESWEIMSATAGFELFWGNGPRSGRACRLLEWVEPGQRELLIFWVQKTCQKLLAEAAVPDPARALGGRARSFDDQVCLRPPSLWHIRPKMAYVASVVLDLPEEHEEQQPRTLVRLIFSDIQVVHKSGAQREAARI